MICLRGIPNNAATAALRWVRIREYDFLLSLHRDRISGAYVYMHECIDLSECIRVRVSKWLLNLAADPLDAATARTPNTTSASMDEYNVGRILMKRPTQSIIHVLTAISPVNSVLVQLMCRLIAQAANAWPLERQHAEWTLGYAE